MDSFPSSATDLTLTFGASLTPVFGDNVQDLLNAGALNVKPTGIIVVNSIDDAVNSSPGVTTLRDAINQANADTGEDLIVFDRSLFSCEQTITLNLGELDITKNLDIIAPRDSLTGGDLLTVSGNKATRVFEIECGSTVSLSGLIVADGLALRGDGGGILNSGTLTLDSSVVRNDSATTNNVNNSSDGGRGGGISNSGVLTVTNSTISSNTTPITGGSSSTRGGGIYNSGTVLLSNSTISDNSAIGIFAGGGGIANIGGSVKVSNSTISGNSAGGSGRNGQADGGGIYNLDGSVEVSNSTISGNIVSGRFGSFGGGIYNGGRVNVGIVNLSNSTISGNSAMSSLGSTVGGIYNDNFNGSSSSASARNTIIAANLSQKGGVEKSSDVVGSFTSNGYNLIGDSTGSTGFGVTGDIVGTSTNPIDPRLAPLDLYGGSTKTLALLPDSPAINAADPMVLDTDPTTDQRGLPRRGSDGRADIGAF